jgi:hypothetical protein
MKNAFKITAYLTAIALMGVTTAQVSAQQDTDTVVSVSKIATPSAADEAADNIRAVPDQTATPTTLHAYPNPMFNDQLTITSEQLRKGDKIELYNISGTRLKTFAAAGKSTTIKLTQLPSGVYIVKAKNAMTKVMKW